MITFRPSPQFDKDATVLFVTKDQLGKKGLKSVPADLNSQIAPVVQTKRFSGDNGQMFPVVHKGGVVLVTGIGAQKDLSLTALRITARKALLSSLLAKAGNIELVPHEKKALTVKALIEAVMIGTYVWDKYKSKEKSDKTVAPKDRKYFLAVDKKKEYEDAMKVCGGVTLARDLVNDNADTVTSVHLEKVIRDLVRGRKNISVEVLNKKEMAAKKLGLHLAVNQGSQKEPKLIIVKYNGAAKKGGTTAFIGKGITFDTGGLNLKPSGHMETMRMDMSGAAAVIGTLKNAIDLNLKKNILFVVGLAENAISSRAYKPGDVIRGYAGKTVEVGNTDAEGRLVLADAIAYVVKNYKPARIVDIATLTGACIVALGNDYTGLVTNDDKFSRQLVRSSNETDDRVWRLPMYPELKDAMKSRIADISNISSTRGAGGTITAAEFLHQFTEGTTWAHLDIAGTAFSDGPGRMYFGYGATGSGVRLMTHYFQHH